MTHSFDSADLSPESDWDNNHCCVTFCQNWANLRYYNNNFFLKMVLGEKSYHFVTLLSFGKRWLLPQPDSGLKSESSKWVNFIEKSDLSIPMTKSPSRTQALDMGRGLNPSTVFKAIRRICIHLEKINLLPLERCFLNKFGFNGVLFVIILPDFIWYLRKSHWWRPSNQISVCSSLCPFFGHCLDISFSDIRWYSSQEKHLESKFFLINIYFLWHFLKLWIILPFSILKKLLLLKYE